MSHLPGTTILLGTTLNVLARLVLGTDGDSLGLGDDYIVRNNLECSSKVSPGDRWRQLRAGRCWEMTILSGTTLNVLARLVLGTDGDSLGLGTLGVPECVIEDRQVFTWDCSPGTDYSE